MSCCAAACAADGLGAGLLTIGFIVIRTAAWVQGHAAVLVCEWWYGMVRLVVTHFIRWLLSGMVLIDLHTVDGAVLMQQKAGKRLCCVQVA
jgi:hypothetical protein